MSATTPAAGTRPYDELKDAASVTEQIAGLHPATREFPAVPVPAGEPPAQPSFEALTAGPLPVRVPGASLPPDVAAQIPHAYAGADLATLWDTAAALRPSPRGDEKFYAAVYARHYGKVPGLLPAPVAEPEAGPAPGPAPEPEPPAAEAFPGWLRDFLAALVGDAAIGISTLIARDGFTDDLLGRAGQYGRLAEVLKDAPDSGAAVRTLLAEGWR